MGTANGRVNRTQAQADTRTHSDKVKGGRGGGMRYGRLVGVGEGAGGVD